MSGSSMTNSIFSTLVTVSPLLINVKEFRMSPFVSLFWNISKKGGRTSQISPIPHSQYRDHELLETTVQDYGAITELLHDFVNLGLGLFFTQGIQASPQFLPVDVSTE